MNNAMWIFYAPFPLTAAAYYGVSTSMIDLLSATFMILTIFLTLPAAWFCDAKGTRVCTIIGAIGTFLCGWVRWFSVFVDDGKTQYWIVFAGQLAGALSQAFLLPPPPKLATNWFATDERVIATGAGALCVVGGIATGYGFGMMVSSPSDIGTLLLVQAILGTVACVPTVFFYKEQPPTPPTPAAAEGQTVSFWETVKRAMSEWRFLVILGALGPGYGAVAALFSVLADLATLPAVGFTQYESGWFGVIMIIVGLVGAAVIGIWCDTYRKYREALIFGFIMAVLGSVWFIFALLYSHSFALTMCGAGFFGFFLMAMLPVGIDAAVEVTFPCPEGTVSGLIFQVGNLTGVILLFVMEALKPSPKEGPQVPYWAFYVVFVVAAAGAALIPFFKGPYKRLEYEKLNEGKGDLRFADQEVSFT